MNTAGVRFPVKDTKEVGPGAQEVSNIAVRRAEEVKKKRRQLVRRDQAYSFKPRDQLTEAEDERRQARLALMALDPEYSFPS